MPFLTVDDGCEIYYETTGSGPALAFAPGFMGITKIWREQIPEFSKEYQCIAYDTRGSGRSDKPLPRVSYGVERHRDDLEAILSFLGVKRVVVIGHSMGGNTACLYALKYPKKTAGIVCAGSFATGQNIKDIGITYDVVKNTIKTKQSRVDFYISVGLPPDIALESANWPLYAMLGNAESFLEFDVTKRLSEIKCPALIAQGDEENVCPVDPSAIYMRDHLPDAQLEVFKGVRHSPMCEDSKKFNTLLSKFLKEKVKW